MPEMEENIGMFRAHDIRIKHQAVTQESLKALMRAVVRYYIEDVKVSSVVLARDARLHCPEFLEALAEEFLRCGVDVYLNPLQISTCRFYYLCMQHQDSGGVMVTASHNPSEYVGLKMVCRDCSPVASQCGPSGGIDRIKEHYKEDRPSLYGKRARLRCISMQEEYIDYSLALAGVEEGSLKGLRVFAEFLSGSAGMDFLLAFSKAGAEVEAAHIVPDGFFPAGDPNPIIEHSVAPARERMRNGSFDIGFIFDGDGDRMDLMFPDGSQILPSMNMSVILPYLLSAYASRFTKMRCFVDMKTCPVAVHEIKETGAEPELVRGGHSFIKEQLRKHAAEGFITAEEETAHYYLNFPVGDKLIASENTLVFALLSAKAMKERPERYERVRTLQKGLYRAREWSLHCSDAETVEKVLSEVKEAFLLRGASLQEKMADGTSLAASLLTVIDGGAWCQLSQHKSDSEDALARWEIAASSQELCTEYESLVRSVADGYVKAGIAHY